MDFLHNIDKGTVEGEVQAAEQTKIDHFLQSLRTGCGKVENLQANSIDERSGERKFTATH